MFIRRLFLHSAILLAIGPSLSMAASPLTTKRSNLPCLVGNTNFAEVLIDNNPRLLGKAYALQDSVLARAGLNIKRTIGPLSRDEIKGIKLPKDKKWNSYLSYIDKELGSLGAVSGLFEIGVYLSEYAMLYFSNKDSYVLVVGNNSQPFNMHASVGKFPIHFGSAATDHTASGPLHSDMGAAAYTHALSFNTANRWNIEHQSKGRVFVFSQDSIAGSSKGYAEGKLGINLHHEWKPSFSQNIDSINLGISWVSGLPTAATSDNPGGLDIYSHANLGSIKLKGEFLTGDTKKTWQRVWGKKKTKKSSDSSSTITGRSKRPEKEDKPSRPITFPYTVHVETSYKLPLRKASTAILGYTWGHSTRLTASERCFLGGKISILENLDFLVACQIEKDLKKKGKDGKPLPGFVEYRNRYNKEWRYSLIMQLNLTA